MPHVRLQFEKIKWPQRGEAPGPTSIPYVEAWNTGPLGATSRLSLAWSQRSNWTLVQCHSTGMVSNASTSCESERRIFATTARRERSTHCLVLQRIAADRSRF
jgi:hypothetical protein